MNPLKAIKVIFFLFFFTCASCKNQNLPADTVVISLEKTPCFGSCESFKLEIFSSGLVRFNGLGNHRLIGLHEAHMEKVTLEGLIQEFRNADFFNFKSQYTGNMKDLPTTYLFFSDNGREMMVQDYYKAPPKLKELEELVQRQIENLKWKKKG